MLLKRCACPAAPECRGPKAEKSESQIAKSQSAAISRLEKDLYVHKQLVIDREKQIQSLNDQILHMDEEISGFEHETQKKEEQVGLQLFCMAILLF